MAAQRTLGAMSRVALTDAVRAMLDPARQFWVVAGRPDAVRAELAEAGLPPMAAWREP